MRILQSSGQSTDGTGCERTYDVLTLTGSVALFEICFEQAWKAMKDILREHGYGESQTGSPKQILKLAYSAGMIQDEKGWLAMLVSRNDVTNSYNEEVALALVKRVKIRLYLFAGRAER